MWYATYIIRYKNEECTSKNSQCTAGQLVSVVFTFLMRAKLFNKNVPGTLLFA